jgi:hypothetical protein
VQHRKYARRFDGRERMVMLISSTVSVDGMATINQQRNGKGREQGFPALCDRFLAMGG